MSANQIGKAAINLIVLGAVVFIGARVIDKVSGKIPV